MKKPYYSFFVFALTLLTFTACDKAKFNTNALVKGDPAYFVVSANNQQTFSLTKPLGANMDTWAKQNNFDPNRINSVKVNEFTLFIVDSSQNPYTFDIVDEVTWSVVTGGVTVASSTTNSFTRDGSTTARLNVQSVDIKKAMNDSTTMIKLDCKSNTPIEHQFTLKAQISYDVNASLNE